MKTQNFVRQVGGTAIALAIGLSAASALAAATSLQGHVPDALMAAIGNRATKTVDKDELARVREAFGIDIESVRFTSTGYALDFRYRVVDAEKAKQLHGVGIDPYLYHPETKSRLAVPQSTKVGSMTQGKAVPREGRTYFTMFANPGHIVKPGDSVTLVIEKLVVKNIIVE